MVVIQIVTRQPVEKALYSSGIVDLLKNDVHSIVHDLHVVDVR